MNISVKVEDEVLKWAGHKAVDLKISRKEYLELCIKACFERENINGSMTPEALITLRQYPLTPDQSFKKKEDE